MEWGYANMKRLMIVAAAASVMAVGAAGVAEAKGPSAIRATPSNACTILTQFHAGGYSTFGGCMSHIHGDIARYRYPSDADPNVLLSLMQRCQQFEAEGGLTYPFEFAEGPDWPFPVLTAQNRRQCATTLYTYHTLAGG